MRFPVRFVYDPCEIRDEYPVSIMERLAYGGASDIASHFEASHPVLLDIHMTIAVQVPARDPQCCGPTVFVLICASFC